MNISQQKTLKLPSKISKYQIVEELGRGGMGIVYKAFAPQMETFIALKTLLGKVGDREIQRFMREARAMAKMNHPNIVKVYDIGVENNLPFFTMHYIEGTSLSSFLENTPLDIRLFSQMMVKIGKAITYAHRQGIVHRDLKPGNILLDKNLEPHIMDFGLVKLTEVDNSLSKTGSILGTPQYMSPQQAVGEKVDQLADVYALGAIFYEMLVKKPAVEGENISTILFNVVHKEPNLLRSVNNKLSKDLEAICYTSLAKDTKKRYQSAEEFTEEIERFLHGELIRAKTVNIWQKVWNKLQKNKQVALAIVFSMLLLTLGIWLFEKQYDTTKEHLQKVTKWQKQANGLSSIDKQMEIYIKVSNLLEKAAATTSPNNAAIKNRLIKIQVKIALLAKEQKNYLLSFALLQQCKRLGYKQANKLLKQLEQQKSQQEKKHRKIASKIMKKVAQKTLSTPDRYVFAIVKMQKPYVVKILVPYLKSKNKNQRFLAIKVLGKLGNTYTKYKGKDCVEHLLGCLEKFRSKQEIIKQQKEVEEIIWALGWLRDARASDLVYKIRWIVGQSDLLWEKTKIPNRWIPIKKEILGKDAQRLITRGTMKQEKEDYLGAISDFSKVIALYPKFSGSYNNRGYAYKIIKNYAKAIADFTTAIALDPKNFLAYSNRGYTYQIIQEYAKAIADFTAAIALNPNFSGAYNNRGHLYHILREHAKALDNYNKAIALNPKYFLAYSNRGKTYHALGKYAKAIADFNKAIALNPKYFLAYNNRGAAYLAMKKYTRAVDNYNKAIALNPRHFSAYNNRGYTYQQLKEYAKALADYSKAIAFNPRYFSGYVNRAALYRNLKQYKKAYRDFQVCLKLAPNHPLAPRIRNILSNLAQKISK